MEYIHSKEVDDEIYAARIVKTINRKGVYEYQTTNGEIFSDLKSATAKQLVINRKR